MQTQLALLTSMARQWTTGEFPTDRAGPVSPLALMYQTLLEKLWPHSAVYNEKDPKSPCSGTGVL